MSKKCIGFDDSIWVTGSGGCLGSAVLKDLREKGYSKVVGTVRDDGDLRDPAQVRLLLERIQPKAIVHCAALVGGIKANLAYPAEFITDNILMSTNVISQAHEHDVENLVYVGANCSYPRDAEQPLREESLLTGPSEASNRAYAAAKQSGLVMTESFAKQYGRRYFSVIPASLYGPGDNFDLERSHVVAGLILRMLQAKRDEVEEFEIWGTGKPRRELMHSDDAARGVVQMLEVYEDVTPINIGMGRDYPIGEVAKVVAEVVGYEGELVFDTSRPDGIHQKLLDSQRSFELGFSPRFDLREGIQDTYLWMKKSEWVRGLDGAELRSLVG